jgi:hypothetical protein
LSEVISFGSQARIVPAGASVAALQLRGRANHEDHCMQSARLAVVLAASSLLSGCWFVFIPGSLINRAADAVTGAEGEHCVGRGTQVGDTITIPGSGAARVLSLSGESSRCTDARYPIRAALAF